MSHDGGGIVTITMENCHETDIP